MTTTDRPNSAVSAVAMRAWGRSLRAMEYTAHCMVTTDMSMVHAATVGWASWMSAPDGIHSPLPDSASARSRRYTPSRAAKYMSDAAVPKTVPTNRVR